MTALGRTLMLAGVLLFVAGLLLYGFPSLPLGRLPGDVRIERPGLRVYLPITTCLIASLVLSGLFWLFSKWR
jgi:hypothetical protein